VTRFEVAIALVMLIGLVGIVVPLVPGSIVIWFAIMAWAFVGNESVPVRAAVAGAATLLIGSALLLATTMPARSTTDETSPPWLPWIVALGTVVGFFVAPVIGGLLGGPVAAFVAESVRLRDAAAGWRSAVRALRGFGIGVAIELIAGVFAIGIWAAAVLTAS
jgi:uncharacterized protein YqgC (DUF456 family)